MLMETETRLKPSRGAEKTPVAIWDLLQWAFQREFASVEFEDAGAVAEFAPASFGMEYVLMERARLGIGRIDGGGSSPPHPDADLVAAALAVLPEGHGGRRMALCVAEYARIGALPNCKPTGRLQCVPQKWGRENQHGRMAATERVGVETYVHRGRVRQMERRACMVKYTDTADELARARRHYLAFWGALMFVRTALADDQLTGWRLTGGMPPMRPWKKQD